jgi:beta-glucanase (GH16 family)
MKITNKTGLLLIILLSGKICAQQTDPFHPDFKNPEEIAGMKLVWHDEFNSQGKPDSASWIYENGYVRNQELQWYQSDNANCANGLLTIEGRKERVKNSGFVAGSADWRTSKEYAEYSSSSIQTRGHKQWHFGRFEIRAKIDTACGAWPAIWTLGISKEWPANGEIDIMEFYRIKGTPTILANFAWGTGNRWVAKWDDLKKPLSDFTASDPDWTKKFHIWRMDWNKDSINLFLDDQLLNTTLLSQTLNPDGFNPFLQPHYLLLNLALGRNGGDPSKSRFPIKYEIDYVRVYQQKD